MSNTVEALPDHPNAQQIIDLMARSFSLRRENRHEEALSCLEEAAGIDPEFYPVLVEKGIVLFELARYEESAECFDLFLKRSSNSQVRELRDRSLVCALESYDRILAEGRPDLEVLIKRGDILQRLNRDAEAVYTYNLAMEIYVNDMVGVLNRRGNSLLYLDKPEEALESYTRALELAPQNASLLFNRGNVLQKLASIDEALEVYSKALEYDPGLAEAKMEKSHCRLVAGDYEKGFLEYESRWETTQLKNARLKTDKPVWLGEQDLAGKTILLWAEQGFGDTIQFLRYVPFVAKTAKLAILRLPASLKTLAESLDCQASIIPLGDSLPDHDLHCPLMSLPLAFGATLGTIPADVPYLHPKPDQVEKWRDLLGPGTRPRIGFVWAGRRREPVNRTRDMRLEFFEPLMNVDADIISLQKEIPDHDKGLIESMRKITFFGEKLTDFADTAALIESLDLVISVDSAVAHLAGSLGKPVWIMLRHSSEWRWLIGRSDSPWYPTARIFRQKTPGDWAGVLSDIILQLKTLNYSK